MMGTDALVTQTLSDALETMAFLTILPMDEGLTAPEEAILSEITFTGPRPGEKLFEELSIEGENMLPTRHPKIKVWKNIPKDRTTLNAEIDRLIETAKTQNYEKIVEAVKILIPEYIGDKTNHS